MSTPRLRIFAGPNGSGKTTIIRQIPEEIHLGYLVNADDIEKILTEKGAYPLNGHQVFVDTGKIQDYFLREGFSKEKIGNTDFISEIDIADNCVTIPAPYLNSYVAADIAGFLRKCHIEKLHSFTFETVLSHPSKLDLVKFAKSKGYRIYLYYIATDSVEINVNRVAIRVAQSGHPVRERSVRERYFKSLELLYDVIKLSDRAYLFDNSGKEAFFVAEITRGEEVELRCQSEEVPEWFITYVVNRSN